LQQCAGSMSTSGNWMPRALKKGDGSWRRGTEFNVDPAAVPPPSAGKRAAPTTAKSMLDLLGKDTGKLGGVPRQRGPIPAWSGGAGDLEDLEEAPAAKRAKEAAATPSPAPAAAAPAPSAAASSDAAADGVDEITSAAPRLAQHICSPKKFNRVAAMLYSLLESGRVNAENASAFFSVLAAGVSTPRACRARELRVAYRRLYLSASLKESLFGAEERAMIDVWRLRVLVQIDLCTDDTFQFAGSVRKVIAKLEQLPCFYPALEPAGAVHLPEAERGRWIDAIFDCVDAAFEQHKHAWARSSVDLLVKAAVERRQNFSAPQQQVLQQWNAACKGQKIQRQQQAARDERSKDLTSYERKEKEWQSADITTSDGGGDLGGGIGNWLAKQNNN